MRNTSDAMVRDSLPHQTSEERCALADGISNLHAGKPWVPNRPIPRLRIND